MTSLFGAVWRAQPPGPCGERSPFRTASSTDYDPEFLLDCIRGLDGGQKSLPCKWLYDDAGSQLFEAICATADYYVTRTETRLLARIMPDVAALLDTPFALVEFGSGASRKTRLVLDAATAAAAYVPIDISAVELARSAAAIERDYPGLRVSPISGDFTGPLALGEATSGLPCVGFFPGSTLGNFDLDGASAFLRSAGAMLGRDGRLLLGIDLAKPAEILNAAYDDSDGVTARFNLNLLARINRELCGDIDISAFEHRAIWNAEKSRVEMHLVSRRPQRYSIAHRRFTMAAGETIHTENSHKFTLSDLHALFAQAGWRIAREWVEPDPAYALFLLDGFADRAPPTPARKAAA